MNDMESQVDTMVLSSVLVLILTIHADTYRQHSRQGGCVYNNNIACFNDNLLVIAILLCDEQTLFICHKCMPVECEALM